MKDYDTEYDNAKTPKELININYNFGFTGIAALMERVLKEYEYIDMETFKKDVNTQYDMEERYSIMCNSLRFKTWTDAQVVKETKRISFEFKNSIFETNISPYLNKKGWKYEGDCDLVSGVDQEFEFSIYADSKELDLDLDNGDIISVPYRFKTEAI